MKKQKFKMKPKPRKPERLILKHSIGIYDFLHKNLEEVVDTAKDYNAPLSEWKFVYHYEDEYDWYCCLEREYPESDEDYKKKLDKYAQQLTKYNKWCKDHAEEIKERENKKKKALETRKKTIRKNLKKEIEKLNKELEKYEGQTNGE